MGIGDIYEDSYTGRGTGGRRRGGKQQEQPREDPNEWFGTYYHKYRDKNKDVDGKEMNSNGGNAKIDNQERESVDGWVEVGEPQLISWDDEESANASCAS